MQISIKTTSFHRIFQVVFAKKCHIFFVKRKVALRFLKFSFVTLHNKIRNDMSMFNQKSNIKAEYNPNSLNLINAGTEIRGDIISNGDVRIDGTLKGTVHTKAKLVIGPTGVIEGDIKAQNADISGNIRGNISVDELLSLKNTAKISGDIITKKLIVETGGEFNGKCQMRSGNESVRNAGTTSANQASQQPVKA